VSLTRYVLWRVGLAIVVAVGSLLFAMLWDPTECMSPAMACPSPPPGVPPCIIPVYCTHLYVSLRVGVAVTGTVIALALLWSARIERQLARGEPAS
jgi:hypothetical protein